MNFEELIDELKKCFLPVHLEQYPDEFGYTVHSGAKIERLGYATNLDGHVASQAISAQVDALITHHDAWEFLYDIRQVSYEKLANAHISHCFVHLPLDSASFGTAVSLARRIGLVPKDTFAFENGLPCGRICESLSPLDFLDLVALVRTATNDHVRYWHNHSKAVSRVGITTGGGNATGYIRQAVDRDCDTFITGETSLYTAQYARHIGVNLIVGTHTHTELPGVQSLVDLLATRASFEGVLLQEDPFELGTVMRIQ